MLKNQFFLKQSMLSYRSATLLSMHWRGIWFKWFQGTALRDSSQREAGSSPIWIILWQIKACEFHVNWGSFRLKLTL